MNLLELKRSGFSDSQAKVVHAASKNFIKDDEDEEVLEEEILVEDLTPGKRTDEMKQEADRIKREGEEAERRAREAELSAKRERELELRRRQEAEEAEQRRREEEAKESEEQRLARVLAETTRLREQEQIALQAKLRAEKEKIMAEKAFAAKALEVAMSTPTVKREPMRQCMRCDKETPAKDMKCAHCGFQATLSGMFSF